MSASNMTPHPLQNANAKLDRTKNQINQLRTMIDGVLRYSSHRRIKRLDQECDEEIWSFELCTPIPQDIPVVIGEILHNLRSPLDHLACALARQHSGTDKGVFFPFGANLEAFEMQANEKCKKLSKDAVDMIRAQRPFRGGNELLWAIHDMNRSDKHREISPINLCTSANSASYLITRSGLALVLGSRTGQRARSDS